MALAVMAPSAANAGGYIGAGLGSGGDLGGSSGFRSDGHYSGRLMLGQRFTLLSLEAGLSGYGLSGAGTEWDALALSAAAKLGLPIVGGFELYGRGGVERTWLGSPTDSSMDGWAGNGYLLGVGAEYRMDVALTDLSVWLDWTHHAADLHQGNARADADVDLWTLGLSVAL